MLQARLFVANSSVIWSPSLKLIIWYFFTSLCLRKMLMIWSCSWANYTVRNHMGWQLPWCFSYQRINFFWLQMTKSEKCLGLRWNGVLYKIKFNWRTYWSVINNALCLITVWNFIWGCKSIKSTKHDFTART